MTRLPRLLGVAALLASLAYLTTIRAPDDGEYVGCIDDAYGSACTPVPTDDDDFSEPDMPALCGDALDVLKDGGVWTLSGGTATIQVGAYASGVAEVALDGDCYDMADDGPSACRLAGEGHSIEVKPETGGGWKCSATGCVVAVDGGAFKYYEP